MLDAGDARQHLLGCAPPAPRRPGRAPGRARYIRHGDVDLRPLAWRDQGRADAQQQRDQRDQGRQGVPEKYSAMRPEMPTITSQLTAIVDFDVKTQRRGLERRSLGRPPSLLVRTSRRLRVFVRLRIGCLLLVFQFHDAQCIEHHLFEYVLAGALLDLAHVELLERNLGQMHPFTLREPVPCCAAESAARQRSRRRCRRSRPDTPRSMSPCGSVPCRPWLREY